MVQGVSRHAALRLFWAVSRPSGISPIVIPRPDQGPASVGLAFDVGGGGLILRIQRVELLVEPMLRRDPRIDRAADRLDRRRVLRPPP